MEEERTRAMTQEETGEEAACLKRTLIIGLFIASILTFFIFTYNEQIHPYPNKYRVITNGHIYKIQKKNWFWPWQIYKEPDGYFGTRTPRYYSESEAKEAVKELEYREARRMRGKEPDPENDWKPLN